jgi:hypothetical protein
MDALIVTLQVLIRPVLFVHSILLYVALHPKKKRHGWKPVFVMTLQVRHSDMAASR